MIAELRTDELATYTVEKRVVKEGDELAQYKSQRDRQRLRNWLGALLKEHDVIIFYIDEDDGLEKFVIGTSKGYDIEKIQIPVIKESWSGEEQDTYHHIPFVSVPDRTPYYIHADDITKFIVKCDNVIEISKKTKLF
jgi:hypothetical protein